MNLQNRSNAYADTLIDNMPTDIYTRCPKAVFAAIAVSALTLGGDYLEEARPRILAEWWCLFDNGIVTQKPPFPRPSK